MTTDKQEYVHLPGQQVIHDGVSNSGAGLTLYSDAFDVGDTPIWSTQFGWADDASNYECLITLWASDFGTPGLDDDTDWVEMETVHGYTGLPNGNPSGGDGKDLVDIGNSGAIWYRWKVVRTVGTAVIQAMVGSKATVGLAP